MSGQANEHAYEEIKLEPCARVPAIILLAAASSLCSSSPSSAAGECVADVEG